MIPAILLAALVGANVLCGAEALRRHLVGSRLDRQLACEHPLEARRVALPVSGSGERPRAAPPSAA
ncbi:MAG TPA: hypothetical protein VMU14_09520 [Acidimicrobiales bacterium]|nr:hypothetical protein [Acidimicrobiales bacterium]